MELEEHNQLLQDVIEIQEKSIALSVIEAIARNENIQKQYEKSNKNHLYSLILLSLTHKAYREDEAKKLWHKITAHMQLLEKNLGRQVGISVATLDYLSNITRVLTNPIIIEEAKSEVVAEFSTIDELTQLYVRDVFDITLLKNIHESTRAHTSLCLLMIDVDDFKKVNDHYGHQKGDEALHKIGHCLNKRIREMDLAARYGGEELAVILPNTDIEEAYIIGERIRKDIKKLDFDGFSVTVSIGIGSTNKPKNTPESLIKQADTALYKAKAAGKNQTVKYG
ncbi:GGDEF domain-containing protein [Colwelliaceae bacterium 6471]